MFFAMVNRVSISWAGPTIYHMMPVSLTFQTKKRNRRFLHILKRVDTISRPEVRPEIKFLWAIIPLMSTLYAVFGQ